MPNDLRIDGKGWRNQRETDQPPIVPAPVAQGRLIEQKAAPAGVGFGGSAPAEKGGCLETASLFSISDISCRKDLYLSSPSSYELMLKVLNDELKSTAELPCESS
ncbi:hypothetical protein Cni_G21442 [Canna indica]|uniref:Uncharacterized protein n=1 Tax=Canna indica TaxID=4628 RepID=A0AAQ3QLN8_9LILI|nr:hypothetical protein Cni_G21442 [Canna indica]